MDSNATLLYQIDDLSSVTKSVCTSMSSCEKEGVIIVTPQSSCDD